MSKKILLVDDEVDLCDLLADRLQDEGYIVKQSHSLSEARDAFDEYLPDVVLSDMSMPGGTGIELFEELKKKPTFSQSRFVLISGFVTHRRDLKLQGIHAVISKPFEFEDLLDAIED